MDNLENKLERLQPQIEDWEQERSLLRRQLQTANEKLQLVKESKDSVIKGLKSKVAEISRSLAHQVEKSRKLESEYTQVLDRLNKSSEELVSPSGQCRFDTD